MQPVHVLADEVLKDAGLVEAEEGHVRQAGPRVLERGIELRRLALLLHGPHALRPSGRRQRTSKLNEARNQDKNR